MDLKSLKIYIHFPFSTEASGGGNQFLKALKHAFQEKGIGAKSPEEADVVLFNSHHKLEEVVLLKCKYPEKVFVHRVDGPLALARGQEKGRKTDSRIYNWNENVADGTVFQSEWSCEENRRCGIKQNTFETVIHNAPDPEIFYPSTSSLNGRGKKARIIMTSWSNNKRKGFDVLEHLDKTLDFSKYELTLVGNVPNTLANATVIPPQNSNKLAETLREYDIFIGGSQYEACSNALLEAMACGLVPIVRDATSYPEIVRKEGLYFTNPQEVPELIEKASHDLSRFHPEEVISTLPDVADVYYDFVSGILAKVRNGSYVPKQLTASVCVYNRMHRVKKYIRNLLKR